MVRSPCCEKMGVKKGAWSSEEDQILVSFIHKHGHANWRALPKQSGLLRCGKSCRLRWINYLRPDIKRGNFSKEEEDNIINLHQMLGNRWSAIAARLPGRTDNEIKNVWHTHLKKKLTHYNHKSSQDSKSQSTIQISKRDNDAHVENSDSSGEKLIVPSPQQCSSQMSSVTDSSIEKVTVKEELAKEETSEDMNDAKLPVMESVEDSKVDDSSMDFWYNLFIRAEDMPDLPNF